MKVDFSINGIPRPAGSKSAFPIARKYERSCPKCAHSWIEKIFTGKVVVTDSSGKEGKTWRQSIAAAAFEAMKAEDLPPFDEPIIARFDFTMPRPKSHYKSNGILKDSAPGPHSVRPDVLKLVRAAEDAMTGIVYTDDARITEERIVKRYGENPGVKITVCSYAFEQGLRETLPTVDFSLTG